MRDASFRSQLAFFVTLGIVCLALLTSLASSWQGSRKIRDNLLGQGARIADNLARQSRLALLYGSGDNAEEAATATLAFPDVVAVEIGDVAGRTILTRTRQPGFEPQPVAQPMQGAEAYLETENEESWQFVAAVQVGGEGASPFDAEDRRAQTIGFVRVVQSKATLTRLMRDVFVVNLGVAALFALAFLAALRFVTGRLLRPLADLSGIMERARAGETGARAQPEGPRDIATMALAFNDMMAALQVREEELRAAVAEAEAASLAKSQFLATMSHEIRTPMNGILGMAQLLLMADLDGAERDDYVRTILNSGQTLLTLLNDILDLSKVEAGKLELIHAAFDARQIADDVSALFSESALRKGLSIATAWHGPQARRYWADPIRLRQMLSNLVANAIKFTSQGYVRIEATEVECDGRTAVLEFAVTDTGIGVPADKQVRLFQPFSQADSSTTRKYGGTGLGLSIVRNLAELMGGEAGVASEAGKGARFWFRIRAEVVEPGTESRQRERAGARQPAATGGVRGARILVVEDLPSNLMVIESILHKLGFATATAVDGEKAVLAATQKERPDLVLMDCEMPVMDGYAATQAIRRWESERGAGRLPIVALTASAFDTDRRRCLEAGMDDFLAKPVDIDKLQITLRQWLED